MNSCCGRMNVKIPSDIAAGDYLLRAEAIALHTAGSAGGAQFYMSCCESDQEHLVVPSTNFVIQINSQSQEVDRQAQQLSNSQAHIALPIQEFWSTSMLPYRPILHLVRRCMLEAPRSLLELRVLELSPAQQLGLLTRRREVA